MNRRDIHAAHIRRRTVAGIEGFCHVLDLILATWVDERRLHAYRRVDLNKSGPLASTRRVWQAGEGGSAIHADAGP
jgi:hypothetical protein